MENIFVKDFREGKKEENSSNTAAIRNLVESLCTRDMRSIGGRINDSLLDVDSGARARPPKRINAVGFPAGTSRIRTRRNRGKVTSH